MAEDKNMQSLNYLRQVCADFSQTMPPSVKAGFTQLADWHLTQLLEALNPEAEKEDDQVPQKPNE